MTRRLIDELLELNPRETAPEGWLARWLDEAIVINADNVSRYYYEIDSRTLTLYDMPNMAPPFENIFIEYRGPSQINQDGQMLRGTNLGKLFRYYGSHIVSYELTEENKREEIQNWSDGSAKWCLIVTQYFMDDSGNLSTVPRGLVVRLYVNKDGTFNSSYASFHKDQESIPDPQDEGIHRLMQDMLNTLVVEFLTISFMHCKNVELVKSHELKQTKKRRKHPCIRYYTLNIHPMMKILNRDGAAQSTGIKLALHICRGHFKDYSEKGLFGKNKGLYWWGEHVRGTPSQGVVIKDYEVKP
jgi:hypothetical protein